MTSEKQIAANQENAVKGGVKSDNGKAISKYNARKHGVLAKSIAEYEGPVLSQYIDALYDEFCPETFTEEILVERIAVNYLKLFRVRKAEEEYLSSCLHPDEVKSLLPDFDDLLVVKPGYKPVMLPENIEKLQGVYQRYETAIENRIYRAIKELLVLRRGR